MLLVIFSAGIHFPVGLNCDQMEHLGEEQYSEYLVERNPRAYMSMREYRDQWMGTPSYSVTPTYAPPPHPQYASWSQPQPPQPIFPIEQAILDLTKLVGDAVVEQKEFNAQLSEKIHTEENSLDQRIDGLKNDFEHKWDNLQDSIESLINQQQCPPEDECLTETILGKQVQLQPQEELKMESVEALEELQDALESGVNFWPWKKVEHISALITEEGSGIEAGKEPQKLTLQPIPLKLNPTATTQATRCPLPVAPSTDQVYILPSPAPQLTSEAPAPKGKSNPSLHVMQNFKRLVASVHNFVTTSKAKATAYTAWHSGWLGCWFEFGAPEPRHF